MAAHSETGLNAMTNYQAAASLAFKSIFNLILCACAFGIFFLACTVAFGNVDRNRDWACIDGIKYDVFDTRNIVEECK
jgi:hypothetical protein